MKRRDTETQHAYANKVFRELKIYDLQGIIHEGDKYFSGIEAYQVKDLSEYRNFEFDKELELARLSFCEQLDAEYNVIVTSENSRSHRIETARRVVDNIEWETGKEMSDDELVKWWKDRQSFHQKKSLYEAKSRIANSRIDQVLFGNSLAWGVNIDGFLMDERKVSAIIEKRITKSSSVPYYDPNIYFHGSHTKSGDYPSWSILWDLAKKIKVPLFLMTFDHKSTQQVGVTRIINVTINGLEYENNMKPNQQIFSSDIKGIEKYLSDNS
jgi:hypothetical protein